MKINHGANVNITYSKAQTKVQAESHEEMKIYVIY